MDTINSVCTHRKMDPTLVESECIKWVLLLLQLVDFTDGRAEAHLRQFLLSRSKVLKSKKCQTEVRKYVSIFQQRLDFNTNTIWCVFTIFRSVRLPRAVFLV